MLPTLGILVTLMIVFGIGKTRAPRNGHGQNVYCGMSSSTASMQVKRSWLTLRPMAPRKAVGIMIVHGLTSSHATFSTNALLCAIKWPLATGGLGVRRMALVSVGFVQAGTGVESVMVSLQGPDYA